VKLRRVVTGHDAAGKALVWQDGQPPGQFSGADKVVATLVWATDETPFDYGRDEDMGARKLGIAPPAGGTRFSVVEIQPGNAPYLHRTDSIDYVICLQGEVEMLLEPDAPPVKLRVGDVMVQRGTQHAWVNRSAAPCRLAVVLVDGKPKRAPG
jgi:quercetin dioxygenase-like cupin family protein